eukprot:4885793-Amphidinium_carterae.1
MPAEIRHLQLSCISQFMCNIFQLVSTGQCGFAGEHARDTLAAKAHDYSAHGMPKRSSHVASDACLELAYYAFRKIRHQKKPEANT